MMVSLRSLAAWLLAIGVVFMHPVQAQSKDDIQKAVQARFQLATLKSDKSDLKEAGTVLVLKKDRILLNKASSPLSPGNVYKNGKVQGDGLVAISSVLDAASTNGPAHYFPVGEKFSVTAIETRADGVILTLMSDFRPVSGERDQRFHGTLKFPFNKGSFPAADAVLAQIAEVVRIDGEPQEDAAPPAAPLAAPLAAPPGVPPPAAVRPASVSAGMSRDQVIAALGVPAKIVHLGAQEIDVFPDMKVVVLTNGTVTQVQ